MATISAVLVPAKALKGGKHKIRISVAHNGETRYIVTDIVVDSEREFRNGAVVKRPDAAYLNTKLRGLLQSYQQQLDKLEYSNGLSCAEVVSQIKFAQNDSHRTIDSVCDEYIRNRRIKQSTAATYRDTWKHISRYLRKGFLIENLNQSVVMMLEQKFRQHGMRPSSIKLHLALLKSIANYARRCGYVEFRIDPFANYTMPATEPREAWLTIEQIRQIRDAELPLKIMRKCRDLFMLSYYLGGINLSDMLRINFNECTETIKYTRKKTELIPKMNKYVEFRIPDEAKPIIARLKGADGRIEATEDQRKRCFNNVLANGFRKIRNQLDIENLIYYSARKSFSQHALELGVKESVIDYILGHALKKAGNTLYHYVYVTPDMATKAVRQVLDNLK